MFDLLIHQNDLLNLLYDLDSNTFLKFPLKLYPKTHPILYL
jgi:hypothetical protein